MRRIGLTALGCLLVSLPACRDDIADVTSFGSGGESESATEVTAASALTQGSTTDGQDSVTGSGAETDSGAATDAGSDTADDSGGSTGGPDPIDVEPACEPARSGLCENPGEVVPCYSGAMVTCDVGACEPGVQRCELFDLDLGQWSECDGEVTPSLEICDAVDNNCDGTADEDLGSVECGLGECLHTQVNCDGGVEYTCDPMEGVADELCDNLDNDCDGDIDEDFEGQTTQCGVGQCEHTVAACVDGVVPSCDPLAGATDEVCDDVDNDCDGEVDEFDDVTCGVGQCEHTVDVCVGGESFMCDPFEGQFASELCDDIDNDCDGDVDEGFDPISCGLGECEHTVEQCVDGVPQSCDPEEGAVTEICDDELDNDCDGVVDNGCVCGNGFVNGTEQCDGVDVGGQTCVGLTFDGGTLGCETDCTYDTSGCYVCGDGARGGAEACDGSDLGGQSCTGLGYDGGTLACAGDCTYDVDPCYDCGDGVPEGPEACDTAGESASCDDDCTAPSCGDGNPNAAAGEACDTGGQSASCDGDCTAVVCGDGTINLLAGELCDDGGESAACDTDCTPSACGDAILNVTAGETCDDAGESLSCDDDCTAVQCGDGNHNLVAGEACDAGGETASCDDDCTLPLCGDGNPNGAAGEDCDDGGESASCDDDCTVAECGDGLLNPTAGESCDGTDLGGASCGSLGEGRGTLACDGSCNYDISGCEPICYDVDDDGSTDCDGDCDDSDPDRYPGNAETCDGQDNDCDDSTYYACPEGPAPCSNALGSQIDMCTGDNYECLYVSGVSECTQLCKNDDDCDAGEACQVETITSANVHSCSDCANPTNCLHMCTTDGNGEGGCDPGQTCNITRIIGPGGPMAVREMYARCLPSTGGATTGQPCGSGCAYGTYSCVGGVCAEPCLLDGDCPNGYHCSTYGVDLTNGSWGAGMTATWTVPVCLADGAGSHTGVGGDACTANGQCQSEFCDANLGICIDLCMFDSDCSNGLNCELALRPTINGWTGAEVCLPPAGYGATLDPM